MCDTHFVVEFAPDELVVFVDELEGVRSVSVHVTMAVGDAPVAEQEHDLMGRLGSQAQEIPKHVSVLSKIVM